MSEEVFSDTETTKHLESGENEYIPIRKDDIPGSVRRIVEHCLSSQMANYTQQLDNLDFEAQNRVADIIQTYRKLMVDALIRSFKTKNVITAQDIRLIHDVIIQQLFKT